MPIIPTDEELLKQAEVERVRRDQCFYRTEKHTCQRIDILLGFPMHLNIEACNRCWDLGGCNSLDGERWCWEVSEKEAELWKKPENIRRAPRSTLVALTVHHLDPEERKKLVENKDFNLIMKKGGMWEKVKASWSTENIKSFFKSMISRAHSGKVSPEVKALRWRSCSGLDQDGVRVRPVCPFFAKSQDGKHNYCNACGCGDKSIAYLNRDEGGYSKLDYPSLECPLEEEGFSNYKAPQ